MIVHVPAVAKVAAAAVSTAVTGLISVGLWAAAFAQDVPGVETDGASTPLLVFLGSAMSATAGFMGLMFREFFMSGRWVRVEFEQMRELLREASARLEDDQTDTVGELLREAVKEIAENRQERAALTQRLWRDGPP